MVTAFEKVRRLEQYLAAEKSLTDSVLDTTLDKLLARERTRILELKARLESQCQTFETTYGQTSANFYDRYQNGELGDEMDYVEWSATIDMLNNLDQKLALLES